MAAVKWEGVFPAVTTKFKENEDLDPKWKSTSPSRSTAACMRC